MTEIIKRETSEVVEATLEDLVSLQATTFQLPEHATRAINTVHVNTLVESDASKWPVLKVVETNEGLAVIDGYHRWSARVKQAAISFLKVEDKTQKEQDKAIEAATLDIAINKQLQEAISKTAILVEIGVYPTVKDIAKAALTANLLHGLPPEGKARVLIALDLYDITRDDTPAPSQAEIARIVGISRAALNQYIKDREKKQTKEKQVEEATSENGASPEAEENKTIAKALKAADKFIASLEELYEASPTAYEQVMAKIFPVALIGTIERYLEVDDKAAVTGLIETIKNGDYVEKDIPHYTRFAKLFTQAAKKLEPVAPKAEAVK